MSIGVLLLQPPDVVDAGEAMRRADSAMYHAKTTGRGVVVWEEGMLQSKAC
jgi:GGDEF domain-containing protein